SGARRSASATASAPFSASPTTSTSGWASKMARNPARTSAWSSQIRTRMLTGAAPRAESGLAPRNRARRESRRSARRRTARLARSFGIRVEHLLAGRRLHHHHADVVGDYVVQLARDPGAFLDDRPLGLPLALALQPRRSRLELGQVGPAGADVVAKDPGDRE